MVNMPLGWTPKASTKRQKIIGGRLVAPRCNSKWNESIYVQSNRVQGRQILFRSRIVQTRSASLLNGFGACGLGLNANSYA